MSAEDRRQVVVRRQVEQVADEVDVLERVVDGDRLGQTVGGHRRHLLGGAEEILDRRIGRNELTAIAIAGVALAGAVLGAPPGTVNGRLRMTEQGEIINEKYGLRGIALRKSLDWRRSLARRIRLGEALKREAEPVQAPAADPRLSGEDAELHPGVREAALGEDGGLAPDDDAWFGEGASPTPYWANVDGPSNER